MEESQSQNSEFGDNLENFHPCKWNNTTEQVGNEDAYSTIAHNSRTRVT